ncbi:MAG: histidine ammonia-lyase [Bacteriovoracaceae bacterium]|nr:histidine ammonia-lyase [Bacteriovoracaceae bacterium]
MKTFEYNGQTLSYRDVYDLSQAPFKTIIGADVSKKIRASREWVDQLTSDDSKVVYGINTGFGVLSSKRISQADLKTLQINLIRSHCTGVGEPFSAELTRMMMLLRATCLMQGHSGVQQSTLELIFKMIELDLLPMIPCQGSVGASGDLAPLAHLALSLIGEGKVLFEGKIEKTSEVFSKLKLSPVTLQAKEGLALINGTNVMAALGAMALAESEVLLDAADKISALSVDTLKGSRAAFDPKIHKLKPHPGQILVANSLWKLLENSPIMNSHAGCGRVQDAYSLRCIPQVHGACRQTFDHAKAVIECEINSVTDNPLLFLEENEVISGGNFHGEAIAMAMDYLAIGMSELANFCERRIEKLVNPGSSNSELPVFLCMNESGLESGFMIAQVTAAALASENKTLCFPASVDSIPTNNDKEDHVSMGPIAGRKLLKIIENTRRVLAIELLCAGQALEFLRPLKTTAPLEELHSKLRTVVPKMNGDRVLSDDIEAAANLISHLNTL